MCEESTTPQQKYEVEQWAKRKGVDILCLTETKQAHTSEEGHEEVDVADEKFKGDFKWFFSTGVDPKTHESITKLKAAGKKVPTD